MDVIENILKIECDVLNKRFFTFHQKKRPYIIIKIAQSADGFMAPDEAKQVWLTNDISKRLSHRWRADEQAILVGTNTALIDNPSLTTRLWSGKNPTRILIDKNNRVPLSQNIFSLDANTIVVNESKDVFGINFMIEPRFIPGGSLGRNAGVVIPPAGAYGLE